jgi:hypothetical protein
MIEREGNAITQAEVAGLSAETKAWFTTAMSWAEGATNPWHAVVAHGLILGWNARVS